MEASKKRPAEGAPGTDGELCCVCVAIKRDPNKKYKVIKPVRVSDVTEVKKQYERWRKKQEVPKNIQPPMSFLCEAFEATNNPVLMWHTSSCRSNFMSSKHLDSYPDKITVPSPSAPELDNQNVEHNVEDEVYDNRMGGGDNDGVNDDSNAPSRILRSQMKQYIKHQHCVVCVAGVEDGPLSKCMTPKRHAQLFELSLKDQKLQIRLAHAYDAIAGDILYHANCLLKQPKGEEAASNDKLIYSQVYSSLKLELQSLTARGHGVLVSECWQRFQDLCNQHNVAVPYYLTVRRKHLLNKLCNVVPNLTILPMQDSDDSLVISSSLSINDIRELTEDEKNEIQPAPYTDNEALQSVHVALNLNRAIHEHKRNTKTLLTEENAFAAVPMLLYMHLALIMTGTDAIDSDCENEDELDEEAYEDAYNKATRLRRDILDVGQNMVFLSLT